jgi:hypothetical protein
MPCGFFSSIVKYVWLPSWMEPTAFDLSVQCKHRYAQFCLCIEDH